MKNKNNTSSSSEKESRQRFNKIIGKELDISTDERTGDDGAYGRAFERAMGVTENNRAEADMVLNNTNIELKTTNGKSTQTLFSCEPKYSHPKIKKSRQFFEKFTPCGARLNTRLTTRRANNLGLYLEVQKEEGKVFVRDETSRYAEWDIEKLAAAARKKLENTLELTHQRGKATELKDYRNFIQESFLELLAAGVVVVEYRISKNGKKNRGTAFRIAPKRKEELFESVEVLTGGKNDAV